MEPNQYWRTVKPRFKAEVGQLRIAAYEPNFIDLVECVEGAGIPRKHWGKIYSKNDYSGCYYENDTPDIVWRFPLSVFDK